tara:strand:+ start:315 stop:428 length:114 start_codon:yes stop_codon:yes gene_type:complete
MLDKEFAEEERPLRSCYYDYGSKKILGIDKNDKVKKI